MQKVQNLGAHVSILTTVSTLSVVTLEDRTDFGTVSSPILGLIAALDVW